jgi:hypothetical protein
MPELAREPRPERPHAAQHVKLTLILVLLFLAASHLWQYNTDAPTSWPTYQLVVCAGSNVLPAERCSVNEAVRRCTNVRFPPFLGRPRAMQDARSILVFMRVKQRKSSCPRQPRANISWVNLLLPLGPKGSPASLGPMLGSSAGLLSLWQARTGACGS